MPSSTLSSVAGVNWLWPPKVGTWSALTETVAALIALAGRRQPSPGLEDWVRRYRPDYRARIAADPVASALVDAALRPPRIAGLLAQPPHPSDRTFYDELRRLRTTPPREAQRDLAVDGHLHADLRTPDVVDRAADLLEWVWAQTLRAGIGSSLSTGVRWRAAPGSTGARPRAAL
jgi:hypothetical protein